RYGNCEQPGETRRKPDWADCACSRVNRETSRTTQEGRPQGQSSGFSLESLGSRRSTPFERSSSSIRNAWITDSILRNNQSRRFRQCIHDCNKGKSQRTKGKSQRTHYDLKSLYQYLSSTDLRLCLKESTACNLRSARHSRGRRPYVLWAGLR